MASRPPGGWQHRGRRARKGDAVLALSRAAVLRRSAGLRGAAAGQVADAWNRHDLEALMSMTTDDSVFEASAGPRGGRTAFPDAHWGRARHFIAGCDLFTFRNGKIAVKNSYRKNRTAI